MSFCMSDTCAAGCHAADTCESNAGARAWPSYMIGVAAPVNRVFQWLAYLYRVDGELYWGVNAADRIYTDPSNSSWQNQLVAGGNGDGSLTYPGRPAQIGGATFVPVASLRLKHIRDGMEDLEYLFVLEETLDKVRARSADGGGGARAGEGPPSGREAVLEHVRKVARATYDFEHSAAPLLGAREAVADAIEAALAAEKKSETDNR